MFDFHSFLLGLQLSSLSFFFIFLVFNSFWFNSWSSFWFNWFCSFIFMIWLSSICFLFEIIIRFLLQSSIWIRLALLLRDCFWMYLSNFDVLLFDLDRFYSFFFFHDGLDRFYSFFFFHGGSKKTIFSSSKPFFDVCQASILLRCFVPSLRIREFCLRSHWCIDALRWLLRCRSAQSSGKHCLLLCVACNNAFIFKNELAKSKQQASNKSTLLNLYCTKI